MDKLQNPFAMHNLRFKNRGCFKCFLLFVKVGYQRGEELKSNPGNNFSCFPSTSIAYDFLRRRAENFIMSARLHPT